MMFLEFIIKKQINLPIKKVLSIRYWQFFPKLNILTILFLVHFNQCTTEQKYGTANFKSSSLESIKIDSRERTYRIFIPSMKKDIYPVIFLFHGGLGSSDAMEYLTDMNYMAEKEGFIVVYPNGTGLAKDKFLTWNTWECCGYALEKKVDDIKYISELLKVIKKDYYIDSNKIFAAGFSNGAMMSLKVACELSNEFKAVASIGGSMFNEKCKPEKRISVLFIHGRKDKIVPYMGGVGANSLTKSAKLPMEKIYQFWRKKNLCVTDTQKNTSLAEIKESSICSSNSKVKIISIFEEGHIWPGGNNIYLSDRQKTDFKANPEIWDFFNSI